MYSVTQIARSIEQPYGGYLRPSSLTKIQLDDGQVLAEKENVYPSLVGTAVDYLTRFFLGDDVVHAFNISIMGASIAEKKGYKGALEKADELLFEIEESNSLKDEVIINACRLSSFDVWYRCESDARIIEIETITPDSATICNIRIMVTRCLHFFEERGPVIRSEFTFEPNGYSAYCSSGDGDYLTSDAMWDIKVLRSRINRKHTLQLLMYWIMGQHSSNDIFSDLKYFGIYNPRLNIVYIANPNSIPEETITIVENDVIRYGAVFDFVLMDFL